MFRKLFRTLTAFVAIVVAYQAYVLFAVPQMEPVITVAKPKPRPSRGSIDATDSLNQYQLLLANYFPQDHWSQKRPPKVFASSNQQAMLVLDEYKRHKETHINNDRHTQVDITRFALLVFPTPPREGITPPRDTIILEAPQGAKLKFDDFRPELGRIGQITGGQFPGRITIRSDMREEGPADDLVIETADLEMNTKLLYSMNPVRFRMGQNVGGGRELEIRFLAEEHVQPKSSGLKIAGIDSLEIRRDLKLRLFLETESLLPGGDATSGSHAPRGNPLPSRSGGDGAPVGEVAAQSVAEVRSHAERGNEELKPPMEVTCTGPFTFDFVRYVASLDRDVELRQIKTNGPADQMFCSQLDLYFTPKATATTDNQPVVVDPGKRQNRDLGRLEPSTIVAQGHPVVVTSPERQAQARGDRIQIALRDQRVRITGARDAMLVYGTNVIRAPMIDYRHPLREAGTPIGRFRATGPGSMHYTPDPAKPKEVFQAAWQKTIDLGREQGQPVLLLDGRPQLAFAAAGSLTADRLKVYLRELERDAPSELGVAVSSSSGAKNLRIAPDRLIAEGNVEIQSSRLTARTNDLLVTFRPQLAGAANATPGEQPASGNLASQLTNPAGGQQSNFHVDSDTMRMDVQLQGQAAKPLTLSCEGNVVFREVPLVATQQQPLTIKGGQLTVDRMESPAPYVTLRGIAPGEAAGSKFAELSGRGMTMLVDAVELDASNYRMRSDGAGKATMMVTRDLNGQTSATPFPLEVTWKGGLEFDGNRTIVFNRNVAISGADDVLRCDRLIAKLTAPIVPGEGLTQKTIDLSEVECTGKVTIDHLTRDKQGVTSHERMELVRLTINQQTGMIGGDGPGVIRSTRFGTGLVALTGKQDPAAPSLISPPPGAPGSKLHFLRVDFRKGMTGNMYTRELAFHENVRAIYGPVDSWDQELDLMRPESLPPDAMTLSSELLRINEDPVAARAALAPGSEKQPIGPVQLVAERNVRIDGQAPRHGAFSATAARVSYDQAKDAFILEGDGRTPATLWRQGQQGAPPQANWIRYVRSTGQISVDKIQYIEITPQDIPNFQQRGPAEAGRQPAAVR
jgi:hypothetical protein